MCACLFVYIYDYTKTYIYIYIYVYSHKHSFIYITRLGSIFISMSISACLSVHVVYMNMPRRELLADVAFFLLRLRVPYLFIFGFIQPSQNRKPHLLGGQQTQLLRKSFLRLVSFGIQGLGVQVGLESGKFRIRAWCLVTWDIGFRARTGYSRRV